MSEHLETLIDLHVQDTALAMQNVLTSRPRLLDTVNQRLIAPGTAAGSDITADQVIQVLAQIGLAYSKAVAESERVSLSRKAHT